MCSPSQSLFSSSRLPFPPDRTRTSCALVELWPTYLAYLVSFSTIGAVWFGHTVITEYRDHADSVLIRLNLLLAMSMVSVMWRYAVHLRLVRPYLGDQDVKTLTKRLTPTLGVRVVMILLGLFLPVLAVLGYLAIAVFILVPFSALRYRTQPA